MIKQKLVGVCKQNWGFLLFIFLMFASRSSLADWYHVPSGSMLPTIEVGDRILVNKMAYRIELPFTDIPLIQTGAPERGDIVTFNSKVAQERLVKRIVGIPGDHISMVNNQLIINGRILAYTSQQQRDFYQEDLLGKKHLVQFVAVPHSKDNFNNIEIPVGYYFVMGDNRNNSVDSRYIGLVSEQELQGKATKVIASFDKDNYYLPKTNRNLLNLN
ncbi:signal peptidase I [Aliiglaciecola sp. 2_MG-2023]|uniref:signal peptidase I n=1 Tax=Alteromonadaceae TaxID=72275 RepID=UPI001C0876CC|nr:MULTISPECIES: signal peptidase I [Aliiglaciecola]MBU2877041.1 signal peptidase I [Aliiglaciecola lipolytica]MDO6712264.1 signal peptidase I [Aliiglaciecola sp. 2_MG-2023]MDO6753330.1 signal peptidase I [Aliiglaciecola sp. 1_MG-2023]